MSQPYFPFGISVLTTHIHTVFQIHPYEEVAYEVYRIEDF